MRWVKFITFAALITGMVTYAGCGEKAVDKMGFGTLENGTYWNEYLGMSVELPNDWHALDDESRKEMMQAGKKMLAGQDKNLQAQLDASELTSVNLFAVSKYPLGSPVPFNPNMACVAEKVSHLPGIKKGSDYLYHAKQLMERSQLKYVFTKDICSEKIGGIYFDVQDVELNIGTLKVKQKYYAAIVRGHALSFIISSTTKQDEESLKQILAVVEFHKP